MEQDCCYFCKQHNKQILYICIDDHDCFERKLCIDCERDSHQNIPKANSLPPEEFQKKLLQKLEGVGEDVFHNNFWNDLKTIAQQIEESLCLFQTQTQFVTDNINNMDKVYMELKKLLKSNQKSILDFNNKDYLFMKNIIRGDQVEKRIEKKNQLGEKFEKLIKNILETIKNLAKEINNHSLSSFSQVIPKYIYLKISGTTLKGQLIFGMKFGEYYYTSDNLTSSEYAGNYQLDEKESFWKEYKKDKVIFVEYNQGQSVGQANQFLQQKQDNNFWCLETYGNLNQFQTLGLCSSQKLKINDWLIYYDGLKCGGGKYDQQGIRTGEWTEPDENFNNENQIILKGIYENGRRSQKWTIYEQDQVIGIGEFDEKNQKTKFWKESKITDTNISYEGNYLLNKKQGQWKIFENDVLVYEGDLNENNIKHGEGKEFLIKNIKGQWWGKYQNGLKQGQWICFVDKILILSIDYTDDIEGDVIEYDLYPSHYKLGRYSNDKKVGQWKVVLNKQIMGEGSYNEFNNKEGSWTEYENSIDEYDEKFNIKHFGMYQNGKKCGLWLTEVERKYLGNCFYDNYGKEEERQIVLDMKAKCLLTGNYKNGIKIGEWLKYYDNQQICRNFYDENGVKVGEWEIYTPQFQNYHKGHFQKGREFGVWVQKIHLKKVGGGIYNNNGQKIEKWEEFDYETGITQTGNYEEGTKIGKWITKFNAQEIGGGSYDKKGKQGEWREFDMKSQTTLQGHYLDNKRIGVWLIFLNEKQIGGGSYNQNGQKQAEWKEFHEKRQQLSIGAYKEGQKVGLWKNEILDQQLGLYDDNGHKNGFWINFDLNVYTIERGQYKYGKRIGYWDIFNDRNEKGGGNYNQDEKVGEWKEFDSKSQSMLTGNYQQGKKHGYWTLSVDFNNQKYIGGGTYSEKGLKEGPWKEFDQFSYKNGKRIALAAYEGHYEEGIKIGKWKVKSENIDIGQGSFDKRGRKHGQWTEYKYQDQQNNNLIIRLCCKQNSQFEEEFVEYYHGYPFIDQTK